MGSDQPHKSMGALKAMGKISGLSLSLSFLSFSLPPSLSSLSFSLSISFFCTSQRDCSRTKILWAKYCASCDGLGVVSSEPLRCELIFSSIRFFYLSFQTIFIAKTSLAFYTLIDFLSYIPLLSSFQDKYSASFRN